MLEYRLELFSYLLSYFIIEILAHYAHLLGPSDGKLTSSEVLDGLSQQIRSVDPCDKRLSFITKLHASLNGVS